MNNEMNLFNFNGNDVEIFEWNGKVLFNPYHCGECLGLASSSVRDNLRKMNEKQVVKLKNSDVVNSNIRNLNNAGENFLTESGVYKLIFKSKKAEAERFQDWVTDEVLPQIRKTGGYIPITENMSDAEIMAKALMVARKTLDEKDELIKEKTRQLEEQKPKVDGFMQFMDVGDSLSFGNVAKNLGIGRNNFMKILRDEKILQEEVMIINGHKKYGEKHNVPYQQFMKYFVVKFKPTKKKKVTVTRVTSNGQDYLRKKLLKLGYLE